MSNQVRSSRYKKAEKSALQKLYGAAYRVFPYIVLTICVAVILANT